MVDLLFFLFPVALLFAARRRFQPLVLSPVKIVVAVLVLIATLGAFSYRNGTQPEGDSFRLIPAQVTNAVDMFAVSALAFVVGAVFYSFAARRPPRRQDLANLRVRTGRLIVAVVVCAALVLASGPSSFLHRSTYLRGAAGDLLIGLTGFSCLAAIAILGYLVAAQPSRRIPYLILAAAFWAVLFSLGTRQFAIAPAVFAVAGYAHQRERAWGRLVAAAVVATFYLVPIPIFLRGQSSHGLVPYWHALGSYPMGFRGLQAAFGSVLSSFPISALSSESHAVSVHSLLTELNPMPGSLAGWYDISRTMRINEFVPYSAIGEIRSVGWIAALLVWFGFGVALAYLDRRSGYWLALNRRVMGIVIVGASAFFAVQAVQYNLRSGSRLLWYALAADLAMRFLMARRRSRAAEPKPVPQLHRRRVGLGRQHGLDPGVESAGQYDIWRPRERAPRIARSGLISRKTAEDAPHTHTENCRYGRSGHCHRRSWNP